MKDIILEKFAEWTQGKSPREARISVFEHIRDIPYALVPELRDPKIGAKKILEIQQGSCQPKHYLLGLCFEKLGIPIKYATYEFRWWDPVIPYSEDLKRLTKELPSAYHLAIKAKIESRWVLVDATWDLPLMKLGFPVNGCWDGVAGTRNAVRPVAETEHNTQEERYDYEMGKRGLLSERDKKLYGEFIPKFNEWISENRSS